jgi:1-deoxy-D-xylulose-5-phosphate reductoisomerase
MLPPLAPPHTPPEGPRGVTVLGSTGSIGRQTLEIAALFPERLQIRALASGSDWAGLAEQARALRPKLAVVADPAAGPALADALEGTGVRAAWGGEALAEAASMDEVEIVVAAIVGAAGVAPTLAAVTAGKAVALANKETLVMAGALVENAAAASGAQVIPVDSEHSAIFQCLVGEHAGGIERLVLTASGGPFRTRPAADFERITPAEALAHPNWSMGAKVTIDSATLMNKGLEVIEAHWLFGVDVDRIEVLVHPQSIIHSIVEFVDGSSKAQLGVPDMRVPIQYALTWPARWPAPHPRVDWAAVGRLDFEKPDVTRFPCLGLAFEALRRGGTAPAVLNAANEVAVARFLREEVRFADIPRLVEGALAHVNGAVGSNPDIDALWAADREARAVASQALAVTT